MDFSEAHFSPRFDFFLVEMTVMLMDYWIMLDGITT